MSPDRRISEAAFAAHGKRPWVDRFAIFCARSLILAELAALTVVFARVWSSTEGQSMDAFAVVRAFFVVAWVVFVTWVLTVGLEFLFRRPRPYATLGKKPLDAFWTPAPSFPSSHSAVAFALAFAAALVVPAPLAAAFFVVAALVAAGRVYVGVHYLSDVLAGAVVGFAAFHVAGRLGFWILGLF